MLYEVEPSLFSDSDGDDMGALVGIGQRLPYLRGLGVAYLWILPFYVSPFKDGGYDVSDHLAVAPRFGPLADMADLLHAADEMDIRILIDLVA